MLLGNQPAAVHADGAAGAERIARDGAAGAALRGVGEHTQVMLIGSGAVVAVVSPSTSPS
jgi:hypothetical protein